MKGSITIKRTHLLNMIQNNRSLFLMSESKESKRFVRGRQTAFEDILEEEWSRKDWNEFMQYLSKILPRYWIGEGLDFVLGVEEG